MSSEAEKEIERRQFNVPLSEEERGALQGIAERNGVTAAAALRMLLRREMRRVAAKGAR